MKNKDFFTIKNNGVDESLRLKDFTTNTVDFPLEAGQFLHVGYYKPFNQFYIEFNALNTEAVSLTFEYYNGNAWVELPAVIDETEDFIKSGFIYFTKPKDWAANEVDDDNNFYIRIGTDNNLTAATKLMGLNILLSNDIDLIGIRSNIVSKLNNGNSWVEKHEAARKHIIQNLRNLGNRKIKIDENSPLAAQGEEKLYFSNLTQFDFLEPFELREASKFYTLSFIYLNELSDSGEENDKWYKNGIRYERMADKAVNLYMNKIDIDDDGKENPTENEGATGTDLTWV